MEELGEWRRPDTMQIRSHMAPAYASVQHIQIQRPSIDNGQRSFTLFSQLPPEIRSGIWRAALTPRIVKWTRINNENFFTVPSKSFPLYFVSREAREMVMLYGEYRDITPGSSPLYFSPLIDYLFFDAGWIDLVRDGPTPAPSNVDPLDLILPDFADMRKIMIHPNFTDERKKPTAMFEKLPKLDQLLIGADEKSMGVHKKFILSTVYDAKMYYVARVKRANPEAKVPRIAVGCLGWRGAERRSLHHGDEDKRQLVGIFEKQWEMENHLNIVREEERQFLEDSFRMKRPKLTLNLRPAHNGEETLGDVAAGGDEEMDINMEAKPPSYSRIEESVKEEDTLLDGSSANPGMASVQDRQNDIVRPRKWYNRILRGQILSLGNSSTVIVKRRE